MMRRPIALSAVLALILFGGNALAANSPAFSYDGHEYAGEQLPTTLRQKLFELETQFNQQRRQVIDQYVIERYLQERAAKEERSVEQLQKELLAVPQPDEKTVREFYDANKARIQGSFEATRKRIADYLIAQRRQQRLLDLLHRIESEKGYKVSLARPQAPVVDVVTAGYPYKGNPKAPVTVVEFADYQCPHCKHAVAVVDKLVKKYGDKIKVVYRDFPINRSGISRKVAEGAVCADAQGRFWAYHDLAFERQDYLKAITPVQLADELGLDKSTFEACYAKQTTKTKVAASLAEAQRLGLDGTPTFFVNGRQLYDEGDLESALSGAIDRALKEHP